DDEEESDSDDEIKDEVLHDGSVGMHNHGTMEGESDVEEVSDTIFENEQYQAHKKDDLNVGQNDIRSKDLFRFTPTVTTEVQYNAFKNSKIEGDECFQNIHDDKVAYEVKKACLLSNSKDDREESICSGHFKKAKLPRSGGLMLQLIDDLVKVGQTMRYNMEGYLKNIEEIINSQGVNDDHR
ncbi:hypothetical protein Tco_1423652, partial [Tanacetum coccineum]